jgi:hypothetical protein
MSDESPRAAYETPALPAAADGKIPATKTARSPNDAGPSSPACRSILIRFVMSALTWIKMDQEARSSEITPRGKKDS